MRAAGPADSSRPGAHPGPKADETPPAEGDADGRAPAHGPGAVPHRVRLGRGPVVEHHRLIDFFISGAIAGVAYGLCFASIGTLVAAAVEKEATGVATGVNSVLRTLGGAIGAQIVAAVLIAHTPDGERLPDVSGYDVGFLLCTLFAAGAFAATLLIPRDRAAGVLASPTLSAARPAAS